MQDDSNLIRQEKSKPVPIYFDVEEGIKYYLPNLRKLIANNFSWNDINKQWNKKINEKIILSHGQGFNQTMTLLTLITNAHQKQNFFSIQFLGFFDHTIKILLEKMTKSEIELIKGNLYDLLIFSDSFLDHFGEIIVLADLLSNHPYRLLKSEITLKKNSTPIDFQFIDTTTNNTINIEVYCIKLTQKNFENKQESNLIEFIKNKIFAKQKQKDKSGIKYKLFPILWLMNNKEKDFMPDLISFFRSNTIEIENVITPHTILLGHDSENLPFVRFLPVTDFKLLNFRSDK